MPEYIVSESGEKTEGVVGSLPETAEIQEFQDKLTDAMEKDDNLYPGEEISAALADLLAARLVSVSE